MRWQVIQLQESNFKVSGCWHIVNKSCHQLVNDWWLISWWFPLLPQLCSKTCLSLLLFFLTADALLCAFKDCQLWSYSSWYLHAQRDSWGNHRLVIKMLVPAEKRTEPENEGGGMAVRTGGGLYRIGMAASSPVYLSLHTTWCQERDAVLQPGVTSVDQNPTLAFQVWYHLTDTSKSIWLQGRYW